MATDQCRWSPDEDGVWFTGCNNAFAFDSGDPRENKFAFCPYCGKTLVVKEQHGD